jgi:hypothetical protein
MSRLSSFLAVALSLAAAPGCGLVDSLTPDDPDIPGDYPQLGTGETARIDVVVDGTPLDATGYCSFDDSGIDEEKLRFDLDVDFLRVEVRDRLEGEYSSRADEVVARWFESTEYESGASCGESLVNFDGAKGYDGLTGDEIATWGTVQLVLCSEEGEQIEVSGKFSCSLY